MKLPKLGVITPSRREFRLLQRMNNGLWELVQLDSIQAVKEKSFDDFILGIASLQIEDFTIQEIVNEIKRKRVKEAENERREST